MSTKESVGTDYRATLNLPKTAFPMRAELPKREPERVAWWQAERVYERRLARNEKNPKWILHDGPPYANGEVHMGTFLNRIMKDVFVKFHLLDGKYANFVPGWDMHGLPIEFETLKHLKLDFRTGDPLELRAKCRERALHWLGVTDDVQLVYALADAFVLPTSYETFSLVTFEAAASGLAVLVTPVSGARDLIQDRQNGFLITRQPEQIAERLAELAAAPPLRARLGAAARESALKFSWERMVAEHQELYARLA